MLAEIIESWGGTMFDNRSGRRSRALVATSVLSAALAIAGPGSARPAEAAVPTPDSTWLETVNIYREQSGLAPVTEEPVWVAGMVNHVAYLKNTPSSLKTGQYASAHTENPASPWYTPSGAAAAGASNIGFGSNDRDAIDVWMRAPFHAIGILRPSLARAAFYRDGTAMLDVIRGIGSDPSPVPTVLFPGPNATTYLNSFTGESPDPREGCAADWTNFRGLPIIAMLPEAPPAGTTAFFTRPNGTTLAQGGELCVQTGSTYNSSDPVYGATGRSILQGDNAVLVIPRAPLTPGLHTVRIVRPGMADVTWSFTMSNAPTAPQSTRAIWAGPGRVRIEWAPPTALGQPVASYNVNGVSMGAGVRSAIVSVSRGLTSGTIPIQAVGATAVGEQYLVPWAQPLLPTGRGFGRVAAAEIGTNAAAGATAVLANIAMTDSPSVGYVTADRCDRIADQPQATATANHGVATAISNLAVVPIDSMPTFCMYSQVPTHLVVDVQGSFSPGGTSRFTAASPTRVLDTRSSSMPGAGSITRVASGAPAGTDAVLANIAMTDALAAGYITADRCSALTGGTQTRASGNHGAGDTVSNLSVVPVDADGSFCIYSQVPTHLVVDVQGRFSAAGTQRLTLGSPRRLLDTRSGGSPAEGSIVTVDTGVSGASAVLVNIAMADSPIPGYVTADRCSSLAGGPQTRATGNHPAYVPVSNLAAVPVDATGRFCIYTQSPTHLIVDLQGSFSTGGELAFTPLSSRRVLDTR